MFTEPGSHLEGCKDSLESLTFAKSFVKLFGQALEQGNSSGQDRTW